MVFYDLGVLNTHPTGAGTLAHWLSLADLSGNATALTEGTDPTEYSLSAGDFTATVKQYGDSVLLTDLFLDTAIEGSLEQVIERISRHAAKKMDLVVRDTVLTAGTNVLYGGTAVARNSIATDGTFDYDVAESRRVINWFRKANVQPIQDPYFVGVIHPDIAYDIEGDSSWVNAHIYAGEGTVETIYKGEIGRLFGIRYVMNTNALVMDASGSAATDVYQSYFFGQEGFGVAQLHDAKVIIKNPHPASDLDLYASVGWKSAFAARQLQASALLRMETGSSRGD